MFIDTLILIVGNSLIYSERAEWCFAATIGLQKKAGRVQRHPKKSAYGLYLELLI